MVPIAENARYGVEVFFVVSGFVVAYSLREVAMTPRTIASFLLRRSVRLDPPYWFAVALAVLGLVFRHVGSRQPLECSLPQVLAHLVYLQGILGYEELSPVFWTLCLELQFYSAFAVLLGLARLVALRSGWSRERVLGALVSALLLVALLWPARVLGPDQPRSALLFPYLASFLSGALTCWTFLGVIPRRVWLTFAAALAGCVVAYHDPTTITAFGTMVALHVAGVRGGLATWLRARPLQYLGRISYSIYIAHPLLASLLLDAKRRFAPTSNAAAFGLLALLVVLTIPVSHLVYVTIEEPCMRLSKRLKSRAR